MLYVKHNNNINNKRNNLFKKDRRKSIKIIKI